MSFTKHTLNQIIESVGVIQKESIEDNDMTEILQALNSLIEISDNITVNNKDLKFYWNEIISDSISVIYSCVSGNYRLAISGLRSILELGCSAFFYMDHKIELKLFTNEDLKADKYVSSLINNYSFFTSDYIRTFYNDIELLQTEQNSVSKYLTTTYGKLCDVVHGRFQALTKKEDLKIEYSKPLFKKFEASYMYTLSILSVMYILRCNDIKNSQINNLARISKTISLK